MRNDRGRKVLVAAGCGEWRRRVAAAATTVAGGRRRQRRRRRRRRWRRWRRCGRLHSSRRSYARCFCFFFSRSLALFLVSPRQSRRESALSPLAQRAWRRDSSEKSDARVSEAASPASLFRSRHFFFYVTIAGSPPTRKYFTRALMIIALASGRMRACRGVVIARASAGLQALHRSKSAILSPASARRNL